MEVKMRENTLAVIINPGALVLYLSNYFYPSLYIFVSSVYSLYAWN